MHIGQVSGPLAGSSDNPKSGEPSRILGFLPGSPIARKLVSGLSGLLLVAFVIIHLLGNLTLFFSASQFNQIGYWVERLGLLTAAVEVLLAIAVSLHILYGLYIRLGRLGARPVAYSQYESAGPPSYQSLGSRSMLVSGGVLGAFLVWHLATFKYGPVYRLPESGHRDLARLVFETFRRPGYTAGYVLALSFLGLHLRHGLWSALQSLGLSTQLRGHLVSAFIGSAIALGFIGLPLAIYFGWLS